MPAAGFVAGCLAPIATAGDAAMPDLRGSWAMSGNAIVVGAAPNYPAVAPPPGVNRTRYVPGTPACCMRPPRISTYGCSCNHLAQPLLKFEGVKSRARNHLNLLFDAPELRRWAREAAIQAAGPFAGAGRKG